jgi:tetratricopeptide (TPR) repeat protein
MRANKKRGATGFLVTGLIFICLLVTGSSRYLLHSHRAESPAEIKEVLMVPPGEVLRQIDLGYHSLAADLLFIQANLYYGQHILTDEQLPWLSDYIDILLELDPNFKKAYLWGAMVTIYQKRQTEYIPDSTIVKANRILERGLARFPGDHRFPMRIAFNYYYEMGDAERAIPYFERAARVPGAPDWLRGKLVDLHTKKGRYEIARRMLAELVMETDDPTLSAALRGRMAALMQNSEGKKLKKARSDLVREWKSGYDYLSLDLYILVREQ